MKKTLLLLILFSLSITGVKGALTADWKIHIPFDQWPEKVVETPNRVYFLASVYYYDSKVSGRDVKSYSLHYYDKEGDEIIPMTQRTNASDNIVSCIAYNPVKHYLAVAYTNCDIDFIYDDGRVENVPALKILSVPGRKEVNSITINTDAGMVYLATTFGYVSLNDTKHEVAESRNYGISLSSAGKCGDYMVLTSDEGTYIAPEKDPRFNLSSYTKLEGAAAINQVQPLNNGNKFLGVKKGNGGFVYLFDIDGNGKATWSVAHEDSNVFDVQQMKDGFLVVGNVVVLKFNSAGEKTQLARPEEVWRMPVGSHEFTEFWVLNSKVGLCSYKSGSPWTLTRNFMRPNSPATYIATSMYYHPDYGLLAGSNGVDISLLNESQNTPLQISGYDGSFWKEYSPAYGSDKPFPNPSNYYGLGVDPQNRNYVYRGSMLNGLVRVNLKNPDDFLVIANPANRNSGIDNFVAAVPDMEVWNALCRFTTPSFDTNGTMWTLYFNVDKDRGELYYMNAADRASSTNASNFKPLKKIELPDVFHPSNYDNMICLTSSQNRNIIAIAGFEEEGTVMFYDTKGTPDVTSDDKYVILKSGQVYDQDGGLVQFLAVSNLYEDPATGLIWIMSQRGLFTVNPQTAFEQPNLVNRIKVARNDGTNLADYLLNEVNVNHITTDGENRKWISTSNGIVCVSQDGRTVYGEFNTDNSYLPDDNVYVACYNPTNNSLMLGTGKGLTEMFPSGSGTSVSTGNEVRVYPNPVEPDYYGWVHIDNIADGSLVKITDSKGGLVKELGPAQSGSVEWDVSGMNHSRVATGVYYIMVSPGAGNQGQTSINKILVLN